MTVIDFTAFIGRLATSSGETILPFFRTSLSVDNKSNSQDFDPVTEADRAAEAVMRRLIKANFPQHGIVGEDSAMNVKTPNMCGCWIPSTAPNPSSPAFRSGAR